MASDVQILISAQDKATDTLNKLVGRLDGLASGLNTSAAAGQRMGESMEQAGRSMLSMDTSIGKFLVNSIYFTAMGAAIQGITDAFKDMVDTLIGFNAKQEQTALGFATMIGSAEGAKTIMADLQNLADKSPFQYKDLTDAARKLTAFGIAAKDVVPDLTTMGNVVSGLGLGKDGLDHITMAMGKLGLETHASAKEIRELNSFGVNAQKYLQQELGLTADQLSHLKDSGVTGAQAMQAIFDGMAKDPMFAGMMEKQSHTLLGMWATLKDQATTIFSSIGQAMVGPIESAVQKIVEKTTKLAGVLRTSGAAGLLQANPGKEEGEGASARDLKELPVIPSEWQVSLSKAYNAVDMFWGECKKAFSSIGQLITDAFGGPKTFDTFIEQVAKAGAVIAIFVKWVADMADSFVLAAKSIGEFIQKHQALEAIVLGVTGAIIAYNAYVAIAAVLSAAWGVVMEIVGPAIWVITEAVEAYGLVEGFATAATILFDAALAALCTPALVVAAVIGTLIAVGYELYENWDVLAPWAENLWNTIKNSVLSAVGALLAGIVKPIIGIYNVIISWFGQTAIDGDQLFVDMGNGIIATLQSIATKVLSVFAPIQEAYNGFAETLGLPLAHAFDVVVTKISSSSTGLTNLLSQMKGFAAASQAGRDAINNNVPWKLDDGDGSGGKGGKGKGAGAGSQGKTPYEEQVDKIIQLRDSLVEKIIEISGTTFDANMAKLQKELDKMTAQITDAKRQGVGTDYVEGLKSAFETTQKEKLNKEQIRAEKELQDQTEALVAKTSEDKIAAANAAYKVTVDNLSKELEAWKKVTQDKEILDARTKAYLNAADKALTDAFKVSLAEQYALNVAYNDALLALGNITYSKLNQMNAIEIKNEQDRLKAIIASSSSTDNQKQQATVDLAATKTGQDKIDASNLETASKQVYEGLKNRTKDYAKLYKEAWSDIESSVTTHLTNMLTFQEKIGKGIKSMLLEIAQNIASMWVKVALEKTLFGGDTSSTLYKAIFGGNKALGGSAFGGNSYVVGEHGPEVFTPSDNGVITSNKDVHKNGNPIIFNIQTPNADSFRKSQGQIYADANRAMSTGRRNM